MHVLSVVSAIAHLSVFICANDNATSDDVLPPDFYFFPNLDAIKEFFRNDSDPLSKEILHTFERDCFYLPDPGTPSGRRKPFIVIEGNHRPSRNVIGMKLARRLNGRYLTNLAPCLLHHFQRLPQGSLTRRVFYLLSVYATVFNAKIHLNLNRAVVLNGYWWEQVTFSLIQALRGAPFPALDSHVFQCPPDLLQPDFIVYVDNPQKPSLHNQRSVNLYRKLAHKYPIMVQPVSGNLREALDNAYANIRENLSDHRDFRFSPRASWTTTPVPSQCSTSEPNWTTWEWN